MKYLLFVFSTRSNVNYSKALLLGRKQYTNKYGFLPKFRETLHSKIETIRNYIGYIPEVMDSQVLRKN
jgi:hypothetical protein